jgi:hypothetical protein
MRIRSGSAIPLSDRSRSVLVCWSSLESWSVGDVSSCVSLGGLWLGLAGGVLVGSSWPDARDGWSHLMISRGIAPVRLWCRVCAAIVEMERGAYLACGLAWSRRIGNDHATNGGWVGVMAVAPRRRNALALIGVLVLVAVPVWIVREIHTSDNPVNSATVWAAYLAVTTPLVSLLGYLIPWWWKGRRATAVVASAAQLAAAADQLAQRMLESWRQQARESRISTPAPVRIWWRWGSAELTPPPGEVDTVPVSGTGPPPLPGLSPQAHDPDPPGVLLQAGIVTQLHEDVYNKLPQGRLVLLGGPGAGKTGAMILLLLAALEHRHTVGEARRAEVPVPVWLTLGGWDPLTQTLHEWAAATMYRDHPYLRAAEYGPDAAAELLRTGRVALFLDGLDEMAPSAQAKALARIEREGAALRLVLSSRPEEYQQAIGTERMHNTAVIEVQPVDPAEARDYLVRDQLGAQRDRWAHLGKYLTDHPDSITAQALNNPLTLSLARATYEGQDQDPTSLTDPARFNTVAALREHLIERILITAYPDERERAHATQWLAWIAHHLGANRDLTWWHIPDWIPQWQLGLAGGLAGGLLGGLAAGLAMGFGTVLAGGLLGGLLGVSMSVDTEKKPRTIFPRWPPPRELSRLLMGGLSASLLAGLMIGGVAGFGLVAGGVAGIWVWLTSRLWALLDLWTVPLPGASTVAPTTSYRIDRRTSIVAGSAGGGIGGGLLGGLAGGLGDGLLGGLMVWLVGGLLCGLMIRLMSGSVTVSLAELILTITGAGKVKFIQVLEVAHQRQVLRQAGAIYQFRHAELQDHLAETHRRHTPGCEPQCEQSKQGQHRPQRATKSSQRVITISKSSAQATRLTRKD